MLNKDIAVGVLNSQALARAKINAENFKKGIDKKLKYGESKCARYVKKALIAGGASVKNSAIESAKNYGPWLIENNFKVVDNATTVSSGGVFTISGQQAGDVVVIQAAPHHVHGHMAMFNGTHWVSDFVQEKGFYPAQIYRDQNIPYKLYRYGDNNKSGQNASATQKGKIKIVWPIPSNSRGSEFSNQEDILSHLAGESTGQYTIGRSGMWHGGIHITEATTPWCALSGKAPLEMIDFPVAFKGEQAIRCMADGEVVAYRVCKDYLTLGWESGPLSFSGSFVLVKHYIQPGEKETSGLHFYTLYMHLAPYSAYTVNPAETKWTLQDSLSAYDPEWVMSASTKNKDVSDSYSKGTMPKGAIVEWNKSDGSLHTVAFNNREYGLVTFVSLSEDAVKKGKKTSFKPGQQYWILVDKNNISPGISGVSQPSWWQKLMPPAKEAMKFDEVVCPTPYAISAGDPVGHMGYYQAPKDGGYEARYQVHIECTSMDDNLEKFLTNPEQVGEKDPLWLKYEPGLALYKKDVDTGKFTKDTRATTRSGLLSVKQVQTETDKTSKQEYWQLRPENAYALKGQAEPQLLSQYDLAKLGFRTETSEPTNFDYLDGKNQPIGFFRRLINSLYEAATGDTRTSHALVKHNYQRLLDKIDSGSDNYSSMEYWRALHNPDYRDVIQKTIVKHPSDWYFKKGDAIWQPFLDALKREAPEWKKYSEDFLDKMAWMQDVTTEKLGPSLWHMHPIMFLGTMFQRQRYVIKYTNYSSTLDSALDKQMALGSRNPLYGPQIGTNHGFVPVSREKVSSYLDPIPYEADENPNMFQFMILTSYIGILKSAIASALKGKGILDGKEDAFIQAAKEHNVNEMYLVAHAIVETGHGTSTLATGNLYNGQRYYNMYGVGAYDGVAVSEGTRFAAQNNWTTPEAAIIGGAAFTSTNFFSRGQDTLYKMRWNPQSPGAHQYATAINWAETQASIIYKMAVKSPDNTIYFDYPIYEGGA